MRGSRHHRRTKGAAALLVLLALVGILVGCGSDSSPEEASSRKKLTEAMRTLADAKSVRASLLLEVEEEGESEDLGCLTVSVDTHGKPERVELGYLDENCSGGIEAHELVAVGRRAWATSSDDLETWREARIAPALLKAFDDERADLGGLIEAAEDIEAVSEGATVKEADGVLVPVPAYHFEAPASAFPGTPADLEDADVEFKAVLDRKGDLREIVVHGGDEDGTGATVTENFDEIGENLGIRPPPASQVEGEAATIRKKADLDRFFGVSTH